MIEKEKLHKLLKFLKLAEKLKDTHRSGFTSEGKSESVAEHTWRLSLMAVLFHNQYFSHLDFEKLLKICLIHDLGEAINGDIPAIHQDPYNSKTDAERLDLLTVLEPLAEDIKAEFLDLWEEYENATSEEARLAKALDKMETLIQHNQGKNPEDFDYEFNLEYGKQYTEYHELISEFRAILDMETRDRMKN